MQRTEKCSLYPPESWPQNDERVFYKHNEYIRLKETILWKSFIFSFFSEDKPEDVSFLINKWWNQSIHIMRLVITYIETTAPINLSESLSYSVVDAKLYFSFCWNEYACTSTFKHRIRIPTHRKIKLSYYSTYTSIQMTHLYKKYKLIIEVKNT